jgi:translocation and assembly module TamB
VTEPSPKRLARRWWKYFLAAACTVFLCFFGLLFYVSTDSFQALVRRRLVAELERVTGGRAEIGSFHTTPFRLQLSVRNITVHGRESSNEVPLAHIDRFVARLKPSSLLRSELAFDRVILDQPVVHVVFYPDGSSNFPPRKLAASSGQTAVEKLFALSIDHFELRHGLLLWNDQTIPLDFTARDTSLQMDYSYLHQRYDGRVLLGLVDTKLRDYRPFAWMTSAEFTLASNSAVITSFQWNSGHSHLSANGLVLDIRHPRLQVTYDAHLDLAEATSIARSHDLRTGLLEFRGHGDWSLDQFSSSGLVTVRDFSWEDDRISFSRASLSSGYSLTDQRLELSKLQGKILGGSFSGDAEIDQWLAPAQHLSLAARKNFETAVISASRPPNKSDKRTPKPKPPAIQNARVTIHLTDLSVEDLAAALNSRAHPLPKVRPAATASGTLEARWKGTPRDTEIQFAVDTVPPAHPVALQLPITSHAQGVYDTGDEALDLSQFALSTSTSHIQASGTLSSASALRLSVSTSSLADWLPFIALVRGPEMFPVSLNGSATFSGNLNGAVSSPQLTGNLRFNDFDFNLTRADNAREVHTHFDTLAGSLQMSFQGIAIRNATLRRDDSSAEFDASATLQHGHFTGDSAFILRANVHHADLADLQAFAGYNYPVSGKADLLVQGTGTLSNPQGDGQIHLAQAMAYGEAIQQFDAAFHLGNGQLAFDNVHLFHGNSTITGGAAYNPSTRIFRVDIAGSNFDLAKVRQIHSNRLSVEGRIDFALKGSGTPERPFLDADIQIRNLALDHELAGDLDLQGVSKGPTLHITGNSRLQRGSLLVNGDVQLRDGFPATLSFQMDQVDLDAFGHAYLPGQLTGHSSVAGSLDLHGPLRDPEKWAFDGDLSTLSVSINKIPLHNQDPIRFSLANQSLNIQQLHLLGEGTDLSAHGSINLSGDRNLDLAANGELDLRLLSTFDPNVTASGVVTMDATVNGTLGDPLPQGRFQVSDGMLAYSGLPSGLSGLSGSLLFTRDHMHIETLSARTGGGTLDLKGDASYLNDQFNFNLTATAKDVRLRYPPGVSSTADAQLHWIGSRSASTLSGDININKMAVTPGFDFSAYLERSRQYTTVTATSSPLNSVKLDIHVVTAPELQMRTAIARFSGDADLHIRGSLGRPAVLGRADVLEGQATFHGTRYMLERGDITFANPVAIEPQLNLQASTHVRNYDLNITMTGTPDRGLNINYRSEPPLPKSDIIALLALGRTSGESTQLQEQAGQEQFSDQATALILSEALNTTVSSRLQRLFGASNIKIDPQGLTTETNPISTGPQITIEQEFANHVSLTYSTNVSQSSQQIIQGEYYFNRNISAVGTRDQNGVVSFDLQIRRRTK